MKKTIETHTWWINPTTLESYYSWKERGERSENDIHATSDKPSKWHIPIVENNIHKGWVFNIDEAKEGKKQEIKQAYLQERNTTATIQSTTLNAEIDCRADDVLNIRGIIDMQDATGSELPGFYKLADNTRVPCTATQFKQVYQELIQGQLALWNKKDTLEEQINNATTWEELEAIVWNEPAPQE